MNIEISKHEAFLKRILYKIDKASELTITGSYRREAHESGDIDVLLKSNDNSIYKKFITILTEYGYLIDNFKTYDYGLYICIVACLIAACISLIIKKPIKDS